MATLRVSGMVSGLDTDSIVQALVSTKAEKVETLEKEQILLEWKQEAWQELNTKIFDFYNSTLTNMRFNAAYSQTSTTSSDESVLKVTSGTGTVNGSQSAFVDALAKAENVTGGELTTENGKSVTGSTKVSDLSGFEESGSFYIKATESSSPTKITITDSTTIDDLTSQLSAAGVTASFDEENGRFFISSNETGAENSFSFCTSDGTAIEHEDENSLLTALGLNKTGGGSVSEGQDAVLTLNGATFTSTDNAFSINGLTFLATGVSDKELSITTAVNYDGIYDSIKNMINQYNEIVNEMATYYNADSSSDLSPLTDEEKAAMTEADIELWESKVKEGMLSGDSTLNTITSALYSTMLQGIDVGGETMYLSSDFGIAGLGYFAASENERYALNIDGDSENSNTSNNTDKLMSMIVTDPDKVISYFTQLSQNLYTELDSKMKSSDLSSIYKVYNDKQMATDISSYTSKIADAEDELTAYEDYWYTKFTAMEVALASLQSKESAVSGLLNL